MKLKYPVEIGCFVLLLAAFNLFSPADPLAFYLMPSALFEGEFARWLSFAWRHNSFYHLALDASAFIFLYETLRCGLPFRLTHLVTCIVFSGLIPLLLDPRLSQIGLCGLSGVAHGLMLICALETAEQPEKRWRVMAMIVFLAVLSKTIFEQVTGNVLLADRHPGSVGIPIASCHFGGLIGAILSYSTLKLLRRRRNSSLNSAHLPPNLVHVHLQTFAPGASHHQLQRHLQCRHAQSARTG